MLTAQYFVFSRLAWQGLDNSASKMANWYLPRKKVDYEQYLDSLLKAPANGQAAVEPVHRQYELLRAWLRKYRALDEHETWAPIAFRPAIIPGDTSAKVPLIRRRLYLLEDFKGDTLSPVFDDELQAAIIHFQNRHGLAGDGLLTKETLAELNVPLKSRIEQIIVNMERCRWLPLNLNTDYLAVNIPEFKLHVYHNGNRLWSCNVVVGKTMHQTTVFYGEIKYVVFRPYWDVPPSIVRKEILRDMRRHHNYLATHQMQIIGYADGLPVIRQLPGPENSLGLVKFLFPNSYNIYLHDTPSKSLFGETARAFSHGCIRVQEPAKLAAFLLKDEEGWDADKIEAAMQSGDNHYVTLQNKVPVFIAYFTAFTGRDQQLNFRKDIYHLDGPLATMILSGKRARR
jgi:murein L,D-transpeptidase YcbB/YkuD